MILAASALVAAAPTEAATHAERSVRQRLVVVSVSDHCVDEFEEDLVIYVAEGEADCKITVKVTGRGKTKSKVALEYYDYDDGWTRDPSDIQTTSSAGRTTFDLSVEFPTDPDSTCYDDDSYSYRFAIARTGRYRAFRSETFEIVYTSSNDNPACDYPDEDDDYGW